MISLRSEPATADKTPSRISPLSWSERKQVGTPISPRCTLCRHAGTKLLPVVHVDRLPKPASVFSVFAPAVSICGVVCFLCREKQPVARRLFSIAISPSLPLVSLIDEMKDNM